MTLFSDFGLAEPILRAIEAEGYTTPTPIQTSVIPVLLAGEDVLGIAQTGTGKTAAFVLPMLERLHREQKRAAPKSTRALILAPTRELVKQIADNIEAYGRHLKLRTAVIVGGVKPSPQVRQLAPGVDIVVATPGRLLDHLSTGVIRLDQTTSVVLDEADQMLDLGFFPAIRKIMAALPKPRQSALMSATMPPAIRELAREFQKAPREIAVAAVSRPIERIVQSVRHVDAAQKRVELARILKGAADARTIVFTRTKHGADRVKRHLEAEGHQAAAIHGNKSQGQRERALGAFRSGEIATLVATDIAARGIDIDDVTHVVNYELPQVAEVYVHRIGRTARAGREGIAISLCDREERSLLRGIEKLIGLKIAVEGAEPAATDASETTSRARQGQRPARAPGDKSGSRQPTRQASSRQGERKSGSTTAGKPVGETRAARSEGGAQNEGRPAGQRRRGGRNRRPRPVGAERSTEPRRDSRGAL